MTSPARRRLLVALAATAAAPWGSALAQSRAAKPAATLTLAGAINKAGRQRMLSQRIAKCYAQVGLAVLPDRAFRLLGESAELFDRQLAELTAFSPTPEAKRLYAELGRAWTAYRDLVRTAPSPETGAQVQAMNEEVLRLAHAGTVELEKQSGTPVGRLVNVSGRQRMLSQRVAKFYFFREWNLPRPVDEDLAKSRDEFQSAMKLLKDAPESTAAIRQQLTLVDSQWLFFDQAIRQRGADAVGRQNVATTSERILEVFESVTGAYEQLGAG